MKINLFSIYKINLTGEKNIIVAKKKVLNLNLKILI